MVEKTRRARERDDGDGDDPDSSRVEWEVFVREDASDPLRHVGRVVAADAAEAHDHASRLFGWYAHDVWLCPAGEVARYSVRAADAGAADDDPGGERGTDDSATTGPAAEERRPEPRVYEETEGTPRVGDSR